MSAAGGGTAARRHKIKAEVTTAEQAYTRLRSVSHGLKNTMTTHRATFAAPVGGQNLRNLYHDIRRRQVEIVNLLRVPGIAGMTRRIQNDAAYDLPADAQTLNGLLNDVRAELFARIPKDANGVMLTRKLNADGTEEDKKVPAADLATLRTLVDAAIANIEV